MLTSYDASGVGIIHKIVNPVNPDDEHRNMEFTTRVKSKGEVTVKVRGITKRFPPSKDWMMIKIVCYEVKEGVYVE